VKRTQIYLDEAQDRDLAKRAAAEGRTKSDLIREALDRYLQGSAEAKEARMQRFRAAVDVAAGIAPYLPDGATYVRDLRERDLIRQREMEQRWRD
jgi:predicted DNA-binding protein